MISISEKKNLISLAAFSLIRTVDRVGLDQLSEILADRAGCGIGRVGGAHDVAVGTAFSPSRTCTTTGPDVMKATSSSKNERSAWTS